MAGDQERGRTPVTARSHRVHWFAGRTHDVLDDLGAAPVWALSVAERRETIAELVALKDRIDALMLEVVAEADRSDDATAGGAVNTAALVRSATRLTGPESSRLVRTARTLESHDLVREALAAGEIRVQQATVIGAAVDALPEEVADRRGAATSHLLAEAATHDAKALRALGKYLLEVVAPDRADALIAAQLEREEAEAARTAYVKTWSDGQGSRHGRFKIPELHAAMLDAMLGALANPARPDPLPREGAASPRVHGQAFCELLERYPVGRLPETGGVTATVVVTIPLETLEGRLRAAELLGTGHRLSPGQARRLACAAGVIPAVLDGRSQVLDWGRRRRLHTKTQRLALAVQQDGYCNITHCDRPATWADAHHRTPWSTGGPTSVNAGELLCPRHHTLAHQGFDQPRRT